MYKELKEFYSNKRVLVTGHTGFKGSWLCFALYHLGADIIGYALDATSTPSLYKLVDIDKSTTSVLGDIRNYNELETVFKKYQPEIVFHLAAQPIVRESYAKPKYTYEVNILGTINVLECCRMSSSVRSVINVTTDKVYENNDKNLAFSENDRLNGSDPYSNSKSCSELITSSYRRSFFQKLGISVSTCRAGNVIGGGDFSIDRIVPDCFRAARDNRILVLRNPDSIRPYQHVLEPIIAYLWLAKNQYENYEYVGSYNIGPDVNNCIMTKELVHLFYKNWKSLGGVYTDYVVKVDNDMPEAKVLRLNNEKMKNSLNLYPQWDIDKSIKYTVEWYWNYIQNMDIQACMTNQIMDYLIEK